MELSVLLNLEVGGFGRDYGRGMTIEPVPGRQIGKAIGDV
jgi:hypothetical protein